MKRKKEHTMNRKEFMCRSTAGVVGMSISGHSSSSLLKEAYALEKKKVQSGKKEYRILGRTGLKVTAVGFGTHHVVGGSSAVKRVVDMGINFIDTGRMYANGRQEEMLGKVIKDVRTNIIIQTKFSSKFINDMKAIEKSIDDSLKALQTDYIDIMLLHGVSKEEELNSPTVMEAFTRAKESGKIRFCGFSTHNFEMLKPAIKSKFYDVAMLPYNHAGHFQSIMIKDLYIEWNQDALEKEIKKAVSVGMGIVAMKTCSGGPLKEEGQPKATFLAALKWILRNKNIGTMAVYMANFRDIEEDIQAMYG